MLGKHDMQIIGNRSQVIVGVGRLPSITTMVMTRFILVMLSSKLGCSFLCNFICIYVGRLHICSDNHCCNLIQFPNCFQIKGWRT
jgi:hypothetical protein